MAIIGRLFNPIRSFVPAAAAGLSNLSTRKSKEKLHRVDSTELKKLVEVSERSSLCEKSPSLPEDRIALSRRTTANLEEKRLQERYNDSVHKYARNREIEKLIHRERTTAQKILDRKPSDQDRRNAKATLAMCEREENVLKSQRKDVISDFQNTHSDYHPVVAAEVERQTSLFARAFKHRRILPQTEIADSYEPWGYGADLFGLGNAGGIGVNAPVGGVEIGTNAATDYIGATVAVSSAETYVAFRKEEKRMNATLQRTEACMSQLPNDKRLVFLNDFLKNERRTVRYCKWGPGFASTGNGIISVVGQYVGAASPVSFFVSAAGAASHTGDMVRQVKENFQRTRNLHREQKHVRDETRESTENLAIEQRHLRQERAMMFGNMASSAVTAAGATMLGVASGAALGGGAVAAAKAAPVLIPVGATLMVPGIVGSYVYNGIIYGKRFTPGLAKQIEQNIERLQVSLDELRKAEERGDSEGAQTYRRAVDTCLEAIPTPEMLDAHVIASERKREIAKEYRKEHLATLPTEHVLKTHVRKAMRSVINATTLGIGQHLTKGMEQKDRERAVRWIDVEPARRVEALQRLGTAFSDSDRVNARDGAPVSSGTFTEVFKALEASPQCRMPIFRILAERVLRRDTKHYELDQRLRMQRIDPSKPYLADEYRGFADLDPNLEKLLARQLATAQAVHESENSTRLLSILKKIEGSEAIAEDVTQSEKRRRILRLLSESIDQYLLFELRDQSKVERGSAVRMKATWRAIR